MILTDSRMPWDNAVTSSITGLSTPLWKRFSLPRRRCSQNMMGALWISSVYSRGWHKCQLKDYMSKMWAVAGGDGDGASHRHRGHQLHLRPNYSSPVLRVEQVEWTISKARARTSCSVLDAPSSNSWYRKWLGRLPSSSPREGPSSPLRISEQGWQKWRAPGASILQEAPLRVLS